MITDETREPEELWTNFFLLLCSTTHTRSLSIALLGLTTTYIHVAILDTAAVAAVRRAGIHLVWDRRMPQKTNHKETFRLAILTYILDIGNSWWV